MKCPNCGSEQVFVLDSRLTEGGYRTWRRRGCRTCGQRYSTIECPVEMEKVKMPAYRILGSDQYIIARGTMTKRRGKA